MSLWFIILLDFVIFWFLFGNTCMKYLRTKKAAVKFELKEFEKQYRNRLRRDGDILSARQCSDLESVIKELQEAERAGLPEAESCLKRFQSGKAGNLHLPVKKCKWLAEQFEVLVVALSIAFGIRALFLQPFKIPTGSMQPTLYGIHFIQSETPYPGNLLKRFFSYLNYSRRHVDVVLQRDSIPTDLQPLPSKPFFPKSVLSFEGIPYEIPAAPIDVYKAISEIHRDHPQGQNFSKEKPFLRGAFELGDHLFVNRLSLCFREPRRGDVMVFVTDNLKDPDGTGFGGRYYIKRLVGLPGDTLLIKDHKLYVREPGQTEFRVLDETDNPGFRRMHSFQGGYHGYAHMPGSLHLRNNQDAFTVPKNHYFMLGDNSENSKDSRYWGTVPRCNLVGTASFVWWPFTRRWGRVNTTEPLPVSTPPNYPALNP